MLASHDVVSLRAAIKNVCSFGAMSDKFLLDVMGAGGGLDWVGIQMGKKKGRNRRQSPNILNKAPAKAYSTKPKKTI